jgi:hypothetical protein
MAVDRSRLTSMIDKLVAVQLDLKPLCEETGSKIQDATSHITIVEACEVLQSAIDDLKQVIFNLEGLPGMVESPSSSTKKSGSK